MGATRTHQNGSSHRRSGGVFIRDSIQSKHTAPSSGDARMDSAHAFDAMSERKREMTK